MNVCFQGGSDTIGTSTSDSTFPVQVGDGFEIHVVDHSCFLPSRLFNKKIIQIHVTDLKTERFLVLVVKDFVQGGCVRFGRHLGVTWSRLNDIAPMIAVLPNDSVEPTLNTVNIP